MATLWCTRLGHTTTHNFTDTGITTGGGGGGGGGGSGAREVDLGGEWLGCRERAADRAIGRLLWAVFTAESPAVPPAPLDGVPVTRLVEVFLNRKVGGLFVCTCYTWYTVSNPNLPHYNIERLYVRCTYQSQPNMGVYEL